MAVRPARLLFQAPNASSLCGFLESCTPPPPPPPPPSSPGLPTTIRFHHSSLLPALPISAAFLIAAAVLVLVLAYFVFRRRRHRRRAAPDEPLAGGPLEEDGGGDGDGHGDEVIHHVWYIRTVGLDESTIRAISALAYKAADGVLGAPASDCAVCLSEFREDELVRLLPKCGHAFHLGCIDTWLRSHVNCPLCRAPVVVSSSAASSGGTGTSTPSSSSSSSSSSASSSHPEFTPDHVDPNNLSSAVADSEQINVRLSESAQGASEEEPEVERLELGAGNRTVLYPFTSSEQRVTVDIGEDGFQPIRRSISMDSFTCSSSIHGLASDEDLSNNRRKPSLEEEVWDDGTRRKQWNASSGASLHKETERSLSSISGRFFLSRQGRARRSLLPL